MSKRILGMILSYIIFMSAVILSTKGISLAILWILGNMAVTLFGIHLWSISRKFQ